MFVKRTVIPYEPARRIGTAYNKECAALDAGDWIIFIDFDVMIMNPYWPEICNDAIEKHGHLVGLFTCFTNRIGCRLQVAPPVAGFTPQNGNWDHKLTNTYDIMWHFKYSKDLYDRNRGRVVDMTKAKGRFSGFFLVTSKKVWEKVGGFKTDSFFHVDVDYYDKVKKAGYHTALIADLYCFHMYQREALKPLFRK
jgi:GT2 family glycosyltransferase